MANGPFACTKILCRRLPQSFLPVGSEIQFPPGGSLGLSDYLAIELRSFLPVQSGCECLTQGRQISSSIVGEDIILPPGGSYPHPLIAYYSLKGKPFTRRQYFSKSKKNLTRDNAFNKALSPGEVFTIRCINHDFWLPARPGYRSLSR